MRTALKVTTAMRNFEAARSSLVFFSVEKFSSNTPRKNFFYFLEKLYLRGNKKDCTFFDIFVRKKSGKNLDVIS